jgi:hypothetical protein
MTWQLALAAILFVVWLGGALYAIVEWIYSDLPPGSRRPWQRRRRKGNPDDGPVE